MKSYALILLLCTLISKTSLAQNLLQTVQLATQELQGGNYQQAEDLYMRAVFFDKSYDYDSIILPGLGLASYQVGHFEQAAQYFHLAWSNTRNEEYLIYEALANIRLNKWLEAKAIALTISGRNKDLLTGLIDFKMGDEQMAMDKLQAVYDWPELVEIEKSSRKSQRKNKYKALALSALLPGAGHAYSGRYGEGLNSLVLNGAVGTLYVVFLRTQGVFDAVISIMPWFHRYYVGGMERAVDLVEIKKEEDRTARYNQLVDLYTPLLDY
ncbi:MAG: hypothetical protein JXQ90_02140 [Cyclobacteriaceae bacterium]